MHETASGDVFVAMSDSQVRRWNGASWTALTTHTNEISLVSGTAPTDIWAISGTAAMHWDGTSWTSVAFPVTSDYFLKGIWGNAPNNYWIAASKKVSSSTIQRTLLHWNGTAWSEDGPYGTEDGELSPVAFASVWGSGADDVYAVSRRRYSIATPRGGLRSLRSLVGPTCLARARTTSTS